jgi:hypothetical protein
MVSFAQTPQQYPKRSLARASLPANTRSLTLTCRSLHLRRRARASFRVYGYSVEQGRVSSGGCRPVRTAKRGKGVCSQARLQGIHGSPFRSKVPGAGTPRHSLVTVRRGEARDGCWAYSGMLYGVTSLCRPSISEHALVGSMPARFRVGRIWISGPDMAHGSLWESLWADPHVPLGFSRFFWLTACIAAWDPIAPQSLGRVVYFFFIPALARFRWVVPGFTLRVLDSCPS